jgi:alpha-N-acetylgalactosaminidase
MAQADRLAYDGFKDVGYQYINIDDCWAAKTRDANGRLQADPIRFPHGIKWLADYVHSKGLKLGIYGDVGNLTCGGYPGNLNHFDIDAQTYADWGVDMFKMDGCWADETIYEQDYPAMGIALNKTGRPFSYSCSWPAYIFGSKIPVPWGTLQKICNLWRLYNDIADSWASVYNIIETWGNAQSQFAPFARPGAWNDPDMLIIGDYSLSFVESQSQMALWSMFAAPLLMGNDLRKLEDWQRDILLNAEVIAVNQDSLGKQGMRVARSKQGFEVWAKPLANGDVAVVLFNGWDAGTPMPISFTFAQVGISSTNAALRDLYQHRDLGIFSNGYSAQVVPHGVVMLRIARQ